LNGAQGRALEDDLNPTGGESSCTAPLSRRGVHFISGLMAHRVPFIAAELGADTDPFVLHLFAALAEKAYQGQPRRCEGPRQEARQPPDMERPRGLGVAAVKAEADRHAATVRPIIENIQARGIISLRAIASELTRMKVPTARGRAVRADAAIRALWTRARAG
jgi:hypothetical protein